MANTLMPRWKAAQQRAETPDLSDAGTDVVIVLVDTADYTFSSAHEFLSDVPAGARVATSDPLDNKTVAASDGAFDSDDGLLVAVTGDVSEALYLVYDTGVEGTSRLIHYYDTGVTGLPVTPNGNDIAIPAPDGGWFTP